MVDTALITQDTTQKVGKIGRFSAYILSTLGYKRNSNSVISTTPTVSYLDLLRIQESLLLLEVDAKEFQERNPQMNPQRELAYIAQKRVECTKLLSTYILETSLREGQLMSKDLFISQSHEKFSIDRPHLYPKTYSRSDSIMQMRNMLVWCISDRLADPADIKPAIRDQLMKNMGEMCMDFF